MAHGPRKTGNFQSGKRPNSDINVTPLVDVVLVLLIIFMVVTPLLEKDIEVRLPEEQEDQPLEAPPDLQQQIVVQVSAGGELALNSEHLANVDELGERLKKAFNARRRGDRLVFFLPEEGANYGTLVKALDMAKSSGADILGMVTTDLAGQQPPGGGMAPGATAATPP